MAKLSGLTEILKRASEDVSKTTASVVHTMREQADEMQTPDFAEQLAGSIEKYADNVAEFLRAIGEQAAALGQSHCAESQAVADNIRQVGRLEAERTKNTILNMRELGQAMAVAKRNFEKAIGRPLNGNGGDRSGDIDKQMPALEDAVLGPLRRNEPSR